MVGTWLEKLLPKDGDLGPIWISVGGGGLGSLGELGGKDILIANERAPASSLSARHATRAAEVEVIAICAAKTRREAE